MHNRISFGAITFTDKCIFTTFCVDKNNIYVAVHAITDSSPGTFGNNLHFDTRIFLKLGQQDIKQP